MKKANKITTSNKGHSDDKRIYEHRSINTHHGKEKIIDIIKKAPTEISMHIFSFLPYQDVLCARTVSHEWLDLVDNIYPWQTKLNRMGITPRSYQQQYFASKTIVPVIVEQMYQLTSSIEYANLGNSNLSLLQFFTTSKLESGDLMYKLAYHHFFAKSIGLSTFELFKNVLKAIDTRSNSDKKDKHYAFILHYLLQATHCHKNSILTHDIYDIPTGAHLGMSTQDYVDISKLINKIINLNIIDINSCYSNGTTSITPLEQILNINYPDIQYNRPSPTIITLLINAGADATKKLPKSPKNVISITQLLLTYEVIFHIPAGKYNANLQNIANQNFIKIFESIYTYEPTYAIKSKFIKEYSRFVGLDNLSTSSNSPLSKEFLNMASLIIQKGGDFGNYEELRNSLNELYRLSKEQSSAYSHLKILIDINTNNIKSMFIPLFINAFIQLKDLKYSMEVSTSNKNSTN